MLVIWSEIADYYFRLEIHAWCPSDAGLQLMMVNNLAWYENRMFCKPKLVLDSREMNNIPQVFYLIKPVVTVNFVCNHRVNFMQCKMISSNKQ